LIDKTTVSTVKLPWDDSAHSLLTSEDKINVLKSLRNYVKSTPSCDVNELIYKIAESVQCEPVCASDSPLDLKMNWEQIAKANDHPLITIGGHSHTHPILSFLNDHDLEFEISTSVITMRENAGISADHYSYPEGMKHCFNEKVIAKLKEYGVKCCPTAMAGVNSCHEDPFHLKRILVINS